ncbi:MAG: type II toxin-antitoxin system VapC family toxin [Nocardioidaceae bacterium]
MTGPPEHTRGLADTNIVILRDWLASADLPSQLAISAVTLAELSAGPHAVIGESRRAKDERARRTAVLQRAESEFDPLPFDAPAARLYGQLASAVIAHGRTPRRRHADLQIAATAAANKLPLYTTNPDDYAGLGDHLVVVPVPRPPQAP